MSLAPAWRGGHFALSCKVAHQSLAQNKAWRYSALAFIDIKVRECNFKRAGVLQIRMKKSREKRKNRTRKAQSNRAISDGAVLALARIALWNKITPWVCATLITIFLVLIVAFFVFAPKDRLDMCIEFVKNTKLPGILSFIFLLGVAFYGAIKKLIGKNSDNTGSDNDLEA